MNDLYLQRIHTDQPRPFVPHTIEERRAAAEAEENAHAASQDEPNRGAVGAWTQGLWRWSEEYNLITTSRAGRVESSHTIAVLDDFGKSPEEIRANALLLTAAPGLLEFVYQVWLTETPGTETYDQAVRLWQQATGASILDYHVARCGAEGRAER